MIAKKKSAHVLLTVLTLYSANSAYADYKFWNDWSQKVMATGASLVAAGGIIGLANWLTHETDEQMVARIDLKLRETQEHIMHAQKLLEIFGVQAVTPYDHERIVHDPCEYVVYDFFVYLTPHVESIPTYCQDIVRLIESLRASRAKLTEHVVRADQGGDVMMASESMRSMTVKIDRMIPALQVLHDYLNTHKKYGKLLTVEMEIAQKYKHELEALQAHIDNQIGLQQAVHQRLHRKQTREFPMIGYVEGITKDIKRLEGAMYGLEGRYPERARWAQILLENLSYIGANMRVDSVYRQQEYERDHVQWKEDQARNMEALRKQEFDVQQGILNSFDQHRPSGEREIYVNLTGTISTRNR